MGSIRASVAFSPTLAGKSRKVNKRFCSTTRVSKNQQTQEIHMKHLCLNLNAFSCALTTAVLVGMFVNPLPAEAQSVCPCNFLANAQRSFKNHEIDCGARSWYGDISSPSVDIEAIVDAWKLRKGERTGEHWEYFVDSSGNESTFSCNIFHFRSNGRESMKDTVVEDISGSQYVACADELEDLVALVIRPSNATILPLTDGVPEIDSETPIVVRNDSCDPSHTLTDDGATAEALGYGPYEGFIPQSMKDRASP